MALSKFIKNNIDHIIKEWEAFAVTLQPAAENMDSLELQDHSRKILLAIAEDLDTSQTEKERALKSKGLNTTHASEYTAAAIHGALRHASGFTLLQLSAEFRAMRASVLRLWMKEAPSNEHLSLDVVMRFNEAIDQALAESIVQYSKRVDHSRDIFLGILGHDLRTPVGAISMAGEILSRPGLAEERRFQLAEAIGRSTNSMTLVIKDLLEYTKISLGNGVPIDLAPADLEKICRDAADEVCLANPERQFRFEPEGELNGSVDAVRLRQVIWNLLNNAFQHGAKGSTVTLSARGDQESIILAVQNYGPTIPEETLKCIFEPLVRGDMDEDSSEAVLSQNLGLGLYIANQFMLAHQGSLTAESSDEGGTIFTATLPRRELLHGV